MEEVEEGGWLLAAFWLFSFFILVPLGLWKFLEILYWIFSNVSAA